MINRINLIMRAKNITAKQFAEEIGIQPSGMSHILGGRNNPSLEFALKVLRRYPEIDANWLLLGRGAMYGDNKDSVAETVSQQIFENRVPIADDADVVDNSSPDTGESLWDDEGTGLSDDGRRVVRMLLMYSDNTFSEFLPR